MLRDDVPVPTYTGRAGRPTKYPWPEMTVGQAFPVHLHNLSNVRAGAQNYGKRHGKQFYVGKADGTDDYWCWRIA